MAAAAGALVVAIVLIAVMSGTEERLTGSNATTSISGVAVTLPAGRQRCQTATVPAHTGQVTVFGARRPGAGPMRIRVFRRGRVVSRAVFRSFATERAYTVRLRPGVTREIYRARLCFDNDGPRNLAFGGDRTPPVGPGNPNQDFGRDDIRTDFSEVGDAHRIALAGQVAERLPLQKSSVLGTWTLWTFLAVVLASFGLAVRVLMGQVRQ